MGPRVRYFLYPLGVYTAFIGVTHVVTQKRIEQRQVEGNSVDKFQPMKVFGRFENPFNEYRPQTLYEFLVMRVIEIWVGEHGRLHDTLEERKEHIGWEPVDIQSLEATGNGGEFMTYTWIGQSCGLVTMPRGGPKVLLDPLFGEHLVSKLGPKRILPIPLGLEELMVSKCRPDYVLVSHDHPDHLERDSVERIGDEAEWIVPTGVGNYLRKNGVNRIREMKWWERVHIDSDGKDEYEVVCLPAMHWSGRVMLDANLTLWSSFMILKNGESMFYHGGDTGYTKEVFKVIGREYGPVKFAALPIGQYCPEWHQKPRHISPEEALQVCEDMSIQSMVGVHWGTFVLSSEAYWEPGEALALAAVTRHGVTSIVPKLGETIKIEC